MLSTVLDYINDVPKDCLVIIHFDCGTTQWRADKSVNKLLAGRIGSHKVKRTMVTYTADNEQVYHIYPEHADGRYRW
jgi:hypothetical protein